MTPPRFGPQLEIPLPTFGGGGADVMRIAVIGSQKAALVKQLTGMGFDRELADAKCRSSSPARRLELSAGSGLARSRSRCSSRCPGRR
jgi:hypothetical protein